MWRIYTAINDHLSYIYACMYWVSSSTSSYSFERHFPCSWYIFTVNIRAPIITLCCMRNMAEINTFTVATVKFIMSWIKNTKNDRPIVPPMAMVILFKNLVDGCCGLQHLWGPCLLDVCSRGKPHRSRCHIDAKWNDQGRLVSLLLPVATS